MSQELIDLFGDVDLDQLRVVRPSKFVFLCGGVIGATGTRRPINLRDYLYRIKKIEEHFNVILAEDAVDLYRLTSYSNLIEFEEDIARVSSLVVLISESAGSLAELGSFASSDIIRPTLRVIMSEDHSKAHSFVRLGPVKLVEFHRRESLGVFPWKSHRKNGWLNVASVRSHYTSIRRYIVNQLKLTDLSNRYSHLAEEQKLLFIIYWVIYISWAISPSVLYDYIRKLGYNLTDKQIRDKVYCLEVVKWVERMEYGPKDYFFARWPTDPFDYRFKAGVSDKDSGRRKVQLSKALRKAEPLEDHVRRTVANARGNRP